MGEVTEIRNGISNARSIDDAMFRGILPNDYVKELGSDTHRQNADLMMGIEIYLRNMIGSTLDIEALRESLEVLAVIISNPDYNHKYREKIVNNFGELFVQYSGIKR